jgi:hypothetical protein
VYVTFNRIVADFAAVTEHDHAVTDPIDVFQAMTDDDDRRTLRFELLN